MLQKLNLRSVLYSKRFGVKGRQLLSLLLFLLPNHLSSVASDDGTSSNDFPFSSFVVSLDSTNWFWISPPCPQIPLRRIQSCCCIKFGKLRLSRCILNLLRTEEGSLKKTVAFIIKERSWTLVKTEKLLKYWGLDNSCELLCLPRFETGTTLVWLMPSYWYTPRVLAACDSHNFRILWAMQPGWWTLLLITW